MKNSLLQDVVRAPATDGIKKGLEAFREEEARPLGGWLLVVHWSIWLATVRGRTLVWMGLCSDLAMFVHNVINKSYNLGTPHSYQQGTIDLTQGKEGLRNGMGHWKKTSIL